jgi:hypothetical protein
MIQQPIEREAAKSKADGAIAVRRRSADVDLLLSALGLSPRCLHHDCRDAQANGGCRRECEKRDPHGAISSFFSNFALVIFERIINVPAPNLFLELCD